MGGDRSAKIAREQDCAEHGSAREGVERGTGEAKYAEIVCEGVAGRITELSRRFLRRLPLRAISTSPFESWEIAGFAPYAWCRFRGADQRILVIRSFQFRDDLLATANAAAATARHTRSSWCEAASTFAVVTGVRQAEQSSQTQTHPAAATHGRSTFNN
jgi:hypothetical protein